MLQNSCCKKKNQKYLLTENSMETMPECIKMSRNRSIWIFQFYRRKLLKHRII